MDKARELELGQWRTVAGTLTADDLDAACAAIGVRLDRARRVYWQRIGVFPFPEVRWLSRPGRAGGSRGYYHRGAPSLAKLLDGLLGTKADGRRRRPSPESVRALLARWWVEAGGDEEAFYAGIERLLRERGRRPLAVAPPPGDGAPRRRESERPRWRTVAGTLTAAELERACVLLGVRLDRARRTYWQAAHVFPHPEVRWLSRPGHQGGARGYYHQDAPLLAVLVDYALRRDHPAKRSRWRCSTPGLGECLKAWWSEAERACGEPDAAEAAFYRRVRSEVMKVGTNETIAGVDPHHADVLPHGARIPPAEIEAARRHTAAAVQTLADAWQRDHGAEDPPDRLVVWFRVERDGPEDWRIVAAGARPTSHDAHRRRLRRRASGGGTPEPRMAVAGGAG